MSHHVTMGSDERRSMITPDEVYKRRLANFEAGVDSVLMTTNDGTVWCGAPESVRFRDIVEIAFRYAPHWDVVVERYAHGQLALELGPLDETREPSTVRLRVQTIRGVWLKPRVLREMPACTADGDLLIDAELAQAMAELTHAMAERDAEFDRKTAAFLAWESPHEARGDA